MIYVRLVLLNKKWRIISKNTLFFAKGFCSGAAPSGAFPLGEAVLDFFDDVLVECVDVAGLFSGRDSVEACCCCC